MAVFAFSLLILELVIVNLCQAAPTEPPRYLYVILNIFVLFSDKIQAIL